MSRVYIITKDGKRINNTFSSTLGEAKKCLRKILRTKNAKRDKLHKIHHDGFEILECELDIKDRHGI